MYSRSLITIIMFFGGFDLPTGLCEFERVEKVDFFSHKQHVFRLNGTPRFHKSLFLCHLNVKSFWRKLVRPRGQMTNQKGQFTKIIEKKSLSFCVSVFYTHCDLSTDLDKKKRPLPSKNPKTLTNPYKTFMLSLNPLKL